MNLRTALIVLAIPMAAIGCTGDVQTTEDSVHLETDLPKVELGEEDVDLDPRTDADIDVDTPRPGDS
jgi:hypothetical protein